MAQDEVKLKQNQRLGRIKEILPEDKVRIEIQSGDHVPQVEMFTYQIEGSRDRIKVGADVVLRYTPQGTLLFGKLESVAIAD